MKRKVGSILSCAFILIAIFIIEVNNNADAQLTEEWVARYNSPGNGFEHASDIVVDSSGNVYVTGSSEYNTSDNDYVTVKYDANGIEQWVARYNGPGNSYDSALEIRVDSLGNVYVTGWSEGNGTDWDYGTIKYDSSGNELWVARYNGPGNGEDGANDMVLDSSGNVYVTGFSEGVGTDLDFATIAYDSFGNELWVARYNGPQNDSDVSGHIDIDAFGNIYVTGFSMDNATFWDYLTIKYDTNGNQLWIARYNGTANHEDRAYDIVVDSSGNIYVTGASEGSGTSFDYATIKYDSNGNELWVARYNSPVNGDDDGRAMTVDPFGNIYVTGYSEGNGTDYDYTTIKYDSNGNELWVARYNGPENGLDHAYDIALDPFGHVFITGLSWGGWLNANGTLYDYATIAYDSYGNEIWVARYNGPGQSDWAYDLTTDSSGYVYVTGTSLGNGTWYDYATIKYSCHFPNQLLILDAGSDQMVYEGEIVKFKGIGLIEQLNILHVSVWQHDVVQKIIDYTGSTDIFSITQVGLIDFNAGTPTNLSLYDAIVFGLSNAFEWSTAPIGRTAELKDYVHNGSGIVWTHDTLDHKWDYGSDVEEPAGVDFDDKLTQLYGLNIPNVEIIMDHEMLHYPFEIGKVGDIIPKTPYPPPWFHYAHTSYSNVTTADIIIQHDTTPESLNYYLTTEEYGQGRVVTDCMGHTIVSEDGSFLGLPSLKECQILVNALYWVAMSGADSLNYSWDFDANIDSDGDGCFTNDIDATGPTPTHIYGDDGVYVVTLTVTDNQNLSGSDTCTITVNNLAPTIIPFGPFTLNENFPFPFNAKARDPGSDDLNFTWSWGDWTSDTINVYYNDGIGSDPYPSPWGMSPFFVNETEQHAYKNYGFYTLNLKVEDDDGGIAIYTTNVTVIGIPQPTLYINTSPDGKDTILYWDPPPVQGIDHYLIYRSTSQTNFDFNTVWKNTSIDKELGEPSPLPLRTIWNDTNAAFPGNATNYAEQYYYVIRAVNIFGEKSRTSRTVGKWTKTFPQGISSFSLPLEPLQALTIDQCLMDMNARYIKWMHPGLHEWMKYGEGGINDTLMKVGEGFEVKFDTSTNHSFTGMPGAMIMYDDNPQFPGFDYATDAKNLTVVIEPNGDVNLTWQEPATMGAGDWYEVYYSNTRDGFFGTFNVNYFSVCPPVNFGNNTVTHYGALANDPGTRLYYTVVPFNINSVRGSSTYSIGIWTEEYLDQYDTIGIPLKPNNTKTADWYCHNIQYTVGINYYDVNENRWCWHSMRMPEEAYDTILVMVEGYQISTSHGTKYTFVGV